MAEGRILISRVDGADLTVIAAAGATGCAAVRRRMRCGSCVSFR
jgi:hypothetical protein